MLDSNTNHFKVDYSAHDIVYKRNKEQGLTGWNNSEELDKQIRQLTGIFTRSDIPKQGQVLDIGCGAGEISFWLETLGYSVTGIDVSALAIEWAYEKADLINSSVNFYKLNAAQNTFTVELKFDIVLDNNCLHCIIGKDRQLYLQNIYKNLKPDGIYICNTMCDDFHDENIRQYFNPESRLLIRNNLAIRYIGRHEDIVHEITDAGFELLYEESTSCASQDSICFIARKDHK